MTEHYKRKENDNVPDSVRERTAEDVEAVIKELYDHVRELEDLQE